MGLSFGAIRGRPLSYDAWCVLCVVALRPEAMLSYHVRSMHLYYFQVDGRVLATLNGVNTTSSEAPGTLRPTRRCPHVATLTMTAAVLLVLFGLDQMIPSDAEKGKRHPYMLRHQACVQSPLLSAEVNTSNYDLGCKEIEASQGICQLVYW